MTIGFIGLGLMGSRMAANLQKAGHALVVHNRTREKATALLDAGATWAENPADVGKQAEVVFTMLSAPAVVREVALASDGLLRGMKRDAFWIDCSTVNPSFAREMACESAGRGVRHLDAPVGGTLGPADEGTLVFMVGGDEKDVEAARPLFDVMGRAVLHMGTHGMGTAMKMVFNMMLGVSMAAFGEALVLGEALGIERGRLLDILLGSPVAPGFLAAKRAMLEKEEYPAYFPLRLMQKDLHLVALTAWEQGVAVPVENAAKESFALAARDHGSDDFFALATFLRNRRG